MNTFLTAFIAAGLCSALTSAKAQQPVVKISGFVLDDNQPVIAATVSLLRTKDSVAVKRSSTDTNGKFILDKLPAGEFIIRVSAVGFNRYQSLPMRFDENTTEITLAPIILQKNTRMLKAVNITARKPMIEQKLDRVVVNVDAFISNTGATALEALEKVPGLTVDEYGNISYKGQTGVMVLIDNRPTYLSGSNLANYLKSLPASQLDKIEFMSNPPARYDAAGSSGVINIRTKKSNIAGFNGSFNAALSKSVYWRNNESLALNYRINKFSFFANAGYNRGSSYRRLDVERLYYDTLGAFKSAYTEEAYFHGFSHSPNLKTGLDYYISPKTTLGLILTAGLSSGSSANPISSVVNTKAWTVDSTILADNYSRSNFKNGSFNLNYSHQFDSLGSAISFDADYLRYDNRKNEKFLNETYNAAGALGSVQNITANLPTLVNIYSIKSDYSTPLSAQATFSIGAKASFVNTDNAANYFNLTNGEATADLNNSNQFVYRESIQAAYLNFIKELKRFSWQTGLRAERTDVNGHQLGNLRSSDSSFVQHYLNLFPTAYLSYKIDTAGDHKITASYSRRINRPYYQDLNPFVYILDKFSTFQGNPFLRPQYSGNYQLSYNYKNTITFSLAYSRITGYKVENDYQQGDIFVASFINLKYAGNRSASLNLNLNPLKQWNINTYLQLTNSRFSGQLNTSYLDISRTTFATTFTSQLKLKRGWSAEMSGFYNNSKVIGQFVQAPYGQLGAGLQKKVFNNKAAVRLSARDIFRRINAGEITNITGMTAQYSNDFANRSLTLGFSYNFGKTLKNQRKHDVTGAEAEASRVKN